MICTVLNCFMEFNETQEKSHYAKYHQEFLCETCRIIFTGKPKFDEHGSKGCNELLVVNHRTKKIKAKKREIHLPSSDKVKILNWLAKMKKADFDPAVTFPSLDISTTTEVCKKKTYYESTDDAILALVNLEQKRGEFIIQMPYRCKHCKGFHNTHLISRRALSDLITKYEKPKKKKKTGPKAPPK